MLVEDWWSWSRYKKESAGKSCIVWSNLKLFLYEEAKLFSTVPQLVTNKKGQISVFSTSESARREKESHERRADTFRSVLHHVNLRTAHAQEMSGVSTNRQTIPCVRVFVLQPRSENRSSDLFCAPPTPLTLPRALLSSLPSLFLLHRGLARHLPLYFLLIISVYPPGGPREAALESPPAHKAGVFFT